MIQSLDVELRIESFQYSLLGELRLAGSGRRDLAGVTQREAWPAPTDRPIRSPRRGEGYGELIPQTFRSNSASGMDAESLRTCVVVRGGLRGRTRRCTFWLAAEHVIFDNEYRFTEYHRRLAATATFHRPIRDPKYPSVESWRLLGEPGSTARWFVDFGSVQASRGGIPANPDTGSLQGRGLPVV